MVEKWDPNTVKRYPPTRGCGTAIIGMLALATMGASLAALFLQRLG
jgi:hypothetical protein